MVPDASRRTGKGIPALHVTQNSTETPIERAIARLSSNDLSAFLRRQRWFGAKAGATTDARIESAIVLPWGNGQYAIARVAVTVGPETQTYQLPIGLAASPNAEIPAAAVIAKVDTPEAAVTIYDAVHDAGFRDGLAGALETGLVVQGHGASRWIIERVGVEPSTFQAGLKSRVSTVEQSNTSIIFGDQAILKLFRRLAVGTQPDVEVTRFLTTRAHFANTPALIAEIRFEDDGAAMSSGVLQQYVTGATDCWSVALEQGRSYFSAPLERESPNTFAAEAKRLGAMTRAMHEALAGDDDDPDFAPEPVSSDDLDRWSHRAQQSIRDSLDLLERQLALPGFPRDRTPEAQALVGRREHYLGWINEIDDQLGDDLGLSARVHGDYHLGQVLRSAAGEFMVIDFEGEPSRSLSERREKTSPLRDVAGMLRSFAYAAATLAQSAGKNVPPHIRELRIGRWERDVRAAFLSGYLADDDEPGLLPEDESHVRQLIAIFETEKAFYELAYELNNRPTWAWIPMRGIAKLFTKV